MLTEKKIRTSLREKLVPRKPGVKINLAKLRRLAARYLPQIRIGLIITAIFLSILLFKALLPRLISFGQLAGGVISSGISLVSQSADDLQGENGRVNLLLLGVSGDERSGDDLTDTIIFVSADPQTGNTLMLSLPRDIWLASMRAKLNTAYHYGNEKKPGGGLVLAKAAVAEILDQPVDYGVVLDFAGFEEIIDILGGVAVEVENGFDDYRYPIPGKENDECDGDPEHNCRYEHLHFEAGEERMDGERALKYVRSRYAEGDEGSDFARSERQQQLLVGIKKELLSFKFLLNPGKVVRLIEMLEKNIETDIPEKNFGGMVKLLMKMQKGNLKSEILNGGAEGKEGFLINPPPNLERYDNHWVLVPQTGDWGEIQKYVKLLLEREQSF
jgi:LCP family protein required for cell wall assembly